MRLAAASIALAACLAGASAQARELAFRASLGGYAVPTDTGSGATGAARIVVDTDMKTVDVTLDVTGIKISDLWDRLTASPMGPIHLHIYGSGNHDHSDQNNVALVFPVPMGPAYSATTNGFHVHLAKAPYAEGAAILKSGTSFDDFLTAMQHGAIVLNIHTNARHDGEISGEVAPAS